MTQVLPSCADCQHFRPDIKRANTCNAFPEGIPEQIWQGRHDHKTAYPGDRGIRYLPTPPPVAPGGPNSAALIALRRTLKRLGR